MKQRLIFLATTLVFLVSLGMGYLPAHVAAAGSPPTSFKYTDSSWSNITAKTSDGNTQTYHREASSTTGDYNGGAAVGYDGCTAIIEPDDQKYDGDGNAQWWAVCDDGTHDKTSIKISGGKDISLGSINAAQQQVYDYEICPTLKGVDQDFYSQQCLANGDPATQSKLDSIVNTICNKYPTQLQAQCADYQNKTYNPDNAPDSTNSCEASGGGFDLNWLLCSAYQGVQAVVNWMFTSIIAPLLSSTPICLPGNDSCKDTIYQIWSNFRIYGDIFLVITLLVIVFGESIGGGMIEAYTAKKVLPRLLAAAILINLSIYIMAFAIDLTNIVGGGIGQLLTSPLHGNGLFTIKPGNITAGAIFGTALGTGLLAGAFAVSITGIALLLLGLAITGAIAVLGVFFTLIIRQSIILALVLVSPVAFALWCLPNTEKWFKRWWDTFFQMLLVYPMVVVLFAVADVMSYLTANNGNGGSYANNIIAFMLLLVPLYLIPFTLRSSNRLMGAIQGAASNVGRQINAVSGRRVLGAAGQEAAKTFALSRSGDRFRGAREGSFQSRLNRGIARASNLDSFGRSGLRPRNIRDDLNAAVVAQKNTARKKLAEESSAFQTFAGNDDMLEAAGLMYHDSEQAARARLERGHITGQAQDTAIAQIRAAQRQMGGQNLALTAAVANAGTGTGYAEGPGQAYDAIARAAGGDMLVAGSAYAEARGGFEKARRFDALEGFAGAMQHMADISASAPGAARDAAIERANSEAADAALEVQGMGAVLGGRGQSVRNLEPALQRRLQLAQGAYHEAAANGSAVIPRYNSETDQMEDVTLNAEEAERNWVQTMASTSAAIDSAGGAAPEVQRLLADTVHNGEVDLTQFPPEMRDILARNPDGTRTTATTIPISTAMNNLEDQEAFSQMKKVYSQRYQQDAAAAATAAPGGAPGAGPPPP